ncbi:hypothetical protein BDQ17DRAFT_1545827 [Cyathus striatus]|nr:hypothetical protein BDQ17DRAFT_1545827 [Cyathus striatus]
MSILGDHIQEIVISLGHSRVVNDLRVAAFSVMVYDYLLMLDLEVNFVWNAPLGAVKILYMLTRYIPFLDTTIGMIVQLLPEESATECKTLYAISTWFLMIGMAAAEAVLTIRTWAVCGSRKWLGIVLLLCFVGIWAGAVVAVARFLSSMTFVFQDYLHPALQGCLITSAKTNFLIVDWSLLFIYDAVNVVLMIMAAYHPFTQGSSSFVRMVLRDGLIYYIYVFVVALANIVVVTSLTVDRIHFRVFSFLFTREPSSIFHELLKPSPESPGAPAPGSSHPTALSIEDIKSEDLETFLRVVLNRQYTNFDFMTTENWITVLNIAHKWRFDVLKDSAIRELQKIQLDTVMRVNLYQKNAVDIRYILPFFVDLCSRNETPTKQESKLLGHESTFVIFQAREVMLRSPKHIISNGQGPPRSPLPNEVPRRNIFKILKIILEIDIDIEDLPGLRVNTTNSTTARNSSTGGTNAQTSTTSPNARSGTSTTSGQTSGSKKTSGPTN